MNFRARARGQALALGLVWALCAPSVRAQPASNPALAQALFEEAQKLVKRRQYASACPKFKASYELDPAGGTLLNLADCYEKEGKVALAWSTFKDAEAAARRDGRSERAEYAGRHIKALESRLVYLEVGVTAAARSPDLAVSVDGAPLAEGAWGMALPVEPGPHSIVAQAPGKEPYEVEVGVSAVPGTREVVEIPALRDVPAAAPPARPNTGAAVPMDEGTSTSSSSQSTIGWIVAGAGMVSLGVGGYFGFRAVSRWDERNAECEGGCTPAAKAAGNEASEAATFATVGIGVGVLAAGVGAVLILSAPDQEVAGTRRSTTLSWAPAPGGGALLMRSTW